MVSSGVLSGVSLLASPALAMLVVATVVELEGERIERPLIPDIRFDVRAINDADAFINNRLTGTEIIRIAHALRLPECIITDARDRVSCYEALAMLLSVSDLIPVPYQGASLNSDMKACNALLASLRVAVELGFNHVKRYFANLEYTRAHKLRLSPVAVTIKCAVLFANIHTCINEGNQVSFMLQLKPRLRRVSKLNSETVHV
ncbi:unnamed protein product [Phytophthora fragariaefolia]|uniref:Unnamed protein product n=1 Tax=Phytophthora fragariaefolia TaxID=1490495 RepID=A0A9W6TYQ1_9STRA|nr:unnamed protein product [Phytophthora fragariaefolia]